MLEVAESFIAKGPSYSPRWRPNVGNIMNPELWLAVLFLAILISLFWFGSTQKVDKQHAQANEQLKMNSELISQNAKMQEEAAQLQKEAAELQQRELDLVTRCEAVMARLEQITNRWEQR
jgi:uncharacterized protein YlxW (UPF0749 family)